MRIQGPGQARPLNDLFVDKLILPKDGRWLFREYTARA